MIGSTYTGHKVKSGTKSPRGINAPGKMRANPTYKKKKKKTKKKKKKTKKKLNGKSSHNFNHNNKHGGDIITEFPGPSTLTSNYTDSQGNRVRHFLTWKRICFPRIEIKRKTER